MNVEAMTMIEDTARSSDVTSKVQNSANNIGTQGDTQAPQTGQGNEQQQQQQPQQQGQTEQQQQQQPTQQEELEIPEQPPKPKSRVTRTIAPSGVVAGLMSEQKTRSRLSSDIQHLKGKLQVVQDSLHLKTKRELRAAVEAAVEIAANLEERLRELEMDGATIRKEIKKLTECNQGSKPTDVSVWMEVDSDRSPARSVRSKGKAQPAMVENSMEHTPKRKNKRSASSPLQEEAGRGKKIAAGNTDQERWEKVEKKKSRRKVGPPKENKDLRRKKKPKTRNDAVKVIAESDVSYADIIKQLNKNDKLKKANAVQAIRRTKKDELLIVLRKGEQTSDFANIVEEELHGKAQVKPLTATRTVEIRDLDETAELQDVIGALKELLGSSAPADIGCVLFRSYGGMQVALVSLPDAAANTLIELGRIRINLVNCRTRERTEVRRCLRCLGFGHVASRCEGPDRKGHCWNCGEAGHLNKDCKKEPSCTACADRKLDSAHKPGSRRCPTFKQELDKQKMAQGQRS